MMERNATEKRTTKETDITLTLCLDGSGNAEVQTGIGFFDHMLESFARHGFFDLSIQAAGDLNVDCHHTVEDIGIVLGTAIRNALGDKEGIRRFGSSLLPMDEALVLAAIDLSGRPYCETEAYFDEDRVGDLETAVVSEFFFAVSATAGMNLHLRVLSGNNGHHIIEAMFKAFARALSEAVSPDPRVEGVLSTKGSL